MNRLTNPRMLAIMLAATCAVILFGATAHSQPVIEFRELEYDWGEITEGDTISYPFRFQNTGTEVLVIEKVKSG